MLAIRMQRTGRKGHAMFRMIVQESRLTPTSGKVVARLGSYDPHAKNLNVDKEKASFYLEHGAQPSDRVATLLKSEGVKLPAWAVPSPKKQSKTRFPEKRRSTAPPEAKAAEPAAEQAVAAQEAAPEAAPEVEAEETKEVEATPAETETKGEAEPEVAEAPSETTEAETAPAETETPVEEKPEAIEEPAELAEAEAEEAKTAEEEKEEVANEEPAEDKK